MPWEIGREREGINYPRNWGSEGGGIRRTRGSGCPLGLTAVNGKSTGPGGRQPGYVTLAMSKVLFRSEIL